jgi:signal transduction histidine kinase
VFRHIRSKLIAAFAVPLIVLVAVAGLEISSTANQMSNVDREASLARASVGPGGTVAALQNERSDAILTVLSLAGNLPTALQGLGPSSAGVAESPQQIVGATDSDLRAFKADVDQSGAQAQLTYKSAFASASKLLAGARQEWETTSASTSKDYQSLATYLYNTYTRVIDEFVNASAGAPAEISDPVLRTGVEALMASMQKTEADWQVTMDLFEAEWTASAGESAAVYLATLDYGTDNAYVRRLGSLDTGPFKSAVDVLLASTLNNLLGADVRLAQQGSAAPLTPLVEAFNQTPSNSLGSSVTEGVQTYVDLGNTDIAKVVNRRATVLHDNAQSQMEAFGTAGAAGAVLGLLLVALVSRSISKPLVDLAHQAGELASTTLPATVQAILDAATTGAEPPPTPKVRVTSRDEVAGMGTALEAVKKTAVELAVGQAALRRDLADAFVNLGRRNQNLVIRQLEYISEIELKEADPESLEELFRLDHLATRMRRNAESLLILAGTGPAREVPAAAPAEDIARAASAEVEDYKRLRINEFDLAMITGAVTTDLVHIMAELTENALSFSPPGSPVEVYGRFVESGYVIVIVDSGIGMSQKDLEIANRRLEGHGAEGEVPGRYLGHFVAGRLASRHGIAISLQSARSGGLVARVKIPAYLIEGPVPEQAVPDQAAQEPRGDYQHSLGAGADDGLGRSEGPTPEWSNNNWSGDAAARDGTGGGVALQGTTGQEDRTGELTWGAPGEAPAHSNYSGPQYAGPQYAGPQPAETQYAAAQYGETQYAETQYGDAQYGDAQYGEPQYGAGEAQSAQGPAAAYLQDGGWSTEEPVTEERWGLAAAASGEAPAQAQAPPASGARDGEFPRPVPDLGLLFPSGTATIGDRFATSAGEAGPDVPAGRRTSAAAWSSPVAPSVGPAAQARNTAEGLRKLTRRVPGAALPEEDDRLRRATPASTTHNPLGLTGALSQYLSATSRAPQKEHNPG